MIIHVFICYLFKRKMGRKKIKGDLKKKTITICLEQDVFDRLEDRLIQNKSKLISMLLKEYFKIQNN